MSLESNSATFDGPVQGTYNGTSVIPVSESPAGFAVTTNYAGLGDVDIWNTVNNPSGTGGFLFKQKLTANTLVEAAAIFGGTTFGEIDFFGQTMSVGANASEGYIDIFSIPAFNINANAVNLLSVSSSGVTPVNGINAAKTFAVSPRLFHTGGQSALSATGSYTAQTPVVTEFYYAEVFVPANCSVTGVAVFNSATISGNMKVGLADSSGNILKTSASTAMAGTTTYQRVAFSGGAYTAAGPATYYVVVFYDNTTVRPNTFTSGNFVAAKVTGQVYATGFTAFTPGSTFTTALGPIAGLY